MTKLELVLEYLKKPELYEVYITKIGYLTELVDEGILILYFDNDYDDHIRITREQFNDYEIKVYKSVLESVL